MAGAWIRRIRGWRGQLGRVFVYLGPSTVGRSARPHSLSLRPVRVLQNRRGRVHLPSPGSSRTCLRPRPSTGRICPCSPFPGDRRHGRPRAGQERYEPARVPQARRPRLHPGEPQGRARADRYDGHGRRGGEGGLRRHRRRATRRGVRQPFADRRHLRRPRRPDRPAGVRGPRRRDSRRGGLLPEGELPHGPRPQRARACPHEHRARHDPGGRGAGADQHPRRVRLRASAVPGQGQDLPAVPGVDHDPVRRADHPALPADGGDRLGERPGVPGDPVRVHGVRHLSRCGSSS